MLATHEQKLDKLLGDYAEERMRKRFAPADAPRHNLEFRDRYSPVVRETVLPVLQEFSSRLRGKVEELSIFHHVNAVGMTMKLDRWDDFRRELVFFSDETAEKVRITHEGTGFAWLSKTLDPEEIDAEMVEEELMLFLERVFEQELLGLPNERKKLADLQSRKNRRNRESKGVDLAPPSSLAERAHRVARFA